MYLQNRTTSAHKKKNLPADFTSHREIPHITLSSDIRLSHHSLTSKHPSQGTCHGYLYFQNRIPNRLRRLHHRMECPRRLSSATKFNIRQISNQNKAKFPNTISPFFQIIFENQQMSRKMSVMKQ